MIHRLRSFVAFGTSGTTYTIDVYGDMRLDKIDYDPFAHSSLQLPSGQSVIRVRQGQYVVHDTGEKLTSTDPGAV